MQTHHPNALAGADIGMNLDCIFRTGMNLTHEPSRAVRANRHHLRGKSNVDENSAIRKPQLSIGAWLIYDIGEPTHRHIERLEFLSNLLECGTMRQLCLFFACHPFPYTLVRRVPTEPDLAHNVFLNIAAAVARRRSIGSRNQLLDSPRRPERMIPVE